MVYDAKFDLNHDGVIDQNDTDLFLPYFDTEVNPTDPLSVACDFNGDGIVDNIDYSGLVFHGTKKSAINWVPWVIIIGIIAVVASSKRKTR